MNKANSTGLTFNTLRDANLARLPEFKNKHGHFAHTEADGSDWSPAQWLQAVVGELGEYANQRKKYERGDINRDEFTAYASEELADVVVYLDILAKQLGINLGEAIITKFNMISDRVGSSVAIQRDGSDWYRLQRGEYAHSPIPKSRGQTQTIVPASPDRLELQSKEFDAVAELMKAYRALPPVVDDDYPEQRDKYESAMRAFVDAIRANGRLDDLLHA